MTENDFIQVDLLAQQGDNLQTNHELVCLDQWRPRFRLATANRDSVSVSSQGRQAECKILDSHLSTRSLTGLLLEFGDYVVMELLSAEHDVARDHEDHDKSYNTYCDPAEFSFPCH